MSLRVSNIGILGAGAFGTALAILYSNSFKVYLYSCFDKHVQNMQQNRINEYFKDFVIPENVIIDNINNITHNKHDVLFWTFPVQPSANILNSVKDKLDGLPIVICSKGINSDNKFLYDVFSETLNNSELFYLSGPNFAHELANFKLSIANLTHKDVDKSIELAKTLPQASLRFFATSDIIGVQVYSAVKNVIAIAGGIIEGIESSSNTSAALLTFAINEMQTLGLAMGAHSETIFSVSGVGDLILTASNKNSRNFDLGYKIATLEYTALDLVNNSAIVCEGYYTTRQIINLAEKYNISMPICTCVYNILYDKLDPKSILDVLKRYN